MDERERKIKETREDERSRGERRKEQGVLLEKETRKEGRREGKKERNILNQVIQ